MEKVQIVNSSIEENVFQFITKDTIISVSLKREIIEDQLFERVFIWSDQQQNKVIISKSIFDEIINKFYDVLSHKGSESDPSISFLNNGNSGSCKKDFTTPFRFELVNFEIFSVLPNFSSFVDSAFPAIFKENNKFYYYYTPLDDLDISSIKAINRLSILNGEVTMKFDEQFYQLTKHKYESDEDLSQL